VGISIDVIGRRPGLAILIAVCVVAVSGCASTNLASGEADAAAKRFAPPANKSYVYIIRQRAVRGQAIHMSISMDREVVGAIQNKTYMLIEVAPGSHVLEIGNSMSGSGSDVDFLHPIRIELETLPGRSYFLAGNLTMGRPNVKIVTEAEGKALIVDNKFKRVQALR
jgi:hypothetical protein